MVYTGYFCFLHHFQIASHKAVKVGNNYIPTSKPLLTLCVQIIIKKILLTIEFGQYNLIFGIRDFFALKKVNDKNYIGINRIFTPVRYALWVHGHQSGAKMFAGLDDVCDRPIFYH